MKEIFGSQTKAALVTYLGLRGGCSGRRLSSVLGIAPTPVFKALHQLISGGIVIKQGKPSFYSLNPHYLYYEELVEMCQKSIRRNPKGAAPILPSQRLNRRVDPLGVYRLLSLRGRIRKKSRLSDRLRYLYG